MNASVLLGISGGIASYKTPLLVRLLTRVGFNVHIVMTQAATRFITPLTLATLSGNPVFDDMWEIGTPFSRAYLLADTAT
jgi:phosphopantothenoylcysteine decarboxylase/phosphopantothenate--cysteine ligase